MDFVLDCILSLIAASIAIEIVEFLKRKELMLRAFKEASLTSLLKLLLITILIGVLCIVITTYSKRHIEFAPLALILVICLFGILIFISNKGFNTKKKQ